MIGVHYPALWIKLLKKQKKQKICFFLVSMSGDHIHQPWTILCALILLCGAPRNGLLFLCPCLVYFSLVTPPRPPTFQVPQTSYTLVFLADLWPWYWGSHKTLLIGWRPAQFQGRRPIIVSGGVMPSGPGPIRVHLKNILLGTSTPYLIWAEWLAVLIKTYFGLGPGPGGQGNNCIYIVVDVHCNRGDWGLNVHKTARANCLITIFH